MASRMMHYAISINLAKELNIKDFNSFAIGNLAPDMIGEKHLDYLKSHFINTCEQGCSNAINWVKFIEKYGHKSIDNDFTLGYFVHLISDAYWSDFIQSKYLSEYPAEIQADNLEQSYRDMKKCNIPLIQYYAMEYALAKVEIPKIEEIDLSYFEEVICALKNDFVNSENSEVHFEIFKFDDIVEYIEKVTKKCIVEVQKLKLENY